MGGRTVRPILAVAERRFGAFCYAEWVCYARLTVTTRIHHSIAILLLQSYHHNNTTIRCSISDPKHFRPCGLSIAHCFHHFVLVARIVCSLCAPC